LRGRQEYLLERFIAKTTPSTDGAKAALATGLAALKAYLTRNLPQIPSNVLPAEIIGTMDKIYEPIRLGQSIDGGAAGDKEAKIKMHIQNVRTATNAILSLEAGNISLDAYFVETQDILAPYLDSLDGSTIDAEDHTIFTKLTSKFETRFTEDMRVLNCRDPDVITRVTEYVPQIVDFVKKIEANGYTYTTSDGSVYFNIEAFEADRNHYAKLQPWNRNDADLRDDGEGSLSKGTSEKKSDADFAIWKSSKPGEPSWPSPWGRGRPGWHIECSAMASDKLGKHMDIHTGGIDLAFPHHDNELAQSEGYWIDKGHMHDHQWVNYFMHMGHLHIQGSKMSKSLKNFTTIRAALAGGDWTPRSLRIAFLQGGWKERIEVTTDIMKAVSAWEDKVNVSI
jgi:cysteinyl-tRNA synthetase